MLMFFPMRKRRRSLRSNKKNRICRQDMCRRPQVGFEPLEQRIVLSVDPSSVLLSAAQVDELPGSGGAFSSAASNSEVCPSTISLATSF